MTATYRFAGGPLDGARLAPTGSPSIVRVPDPPGRYVQDVASGTYRWYPAPVAVDVLPCETVVDVDELRLVREGSA